MNLTPARFQRKAARAEAAIRRAREAVTTAPVVGYRLGLMAPADLDRILVNVGTLVALGAWTAENDANLAREFTDRERAALYAAVLAHIVPALLEEP